MASKTYAEKLESPKWQRKRLEIFSRDNWACKWCGNDKDHLHVHHLKYLSNREPWDYDDDNLITLCYKCHEQAHYPFIISEEYEEYGDVNYSNLFLYIKNNVNLNDPEHLKDFIIGLQRIWFKRIGIRGFNLYLMRRKINEPDSRDKDVLFDLSYHNVDYDNTTFYSNALKKQDEINYDLGF
jgi:hypothetical protein